MEARKETPRTVAEIKPAPYNARTITADELGMLGGAMLEFGDLGGIVFNIRSGNAVGGHQRTKNLPPDAVIVVTERFDPPTPQGTVAVGYIEHGGERWSYREVDWDDQKEIAANLAANKHGGTWDVPKLAPLIHSLDTRGFDMKLTGFVGPELQQLKKWHVHSAAPNNEPPAGNTGYKEQYGVIVVCKNESEQEAVYNELKGRGLECRVVVT